MKFGRFLAIALALVGTPALPQSKINLETQVKGTLPQANGGTGATTASGARTGLDVYSTGEVDAAIATVAGTGGSGTPTNGVASGCGVTYSGSGLGFAMSTCSARINGTLVSGAAQTVTLSAADATNPRIDVFYIDDTGTFGKITGTPAATPSQPTVDPATQLYLGFALVPATATNLTSGFTTTVIYDEGTEWTCTGSGITCNSTSNPNSGTKDIEATTISAGDYVKLVNGSPVSFDGDGNLILSIRSKATWNTKRSLTLQWYLSGVAKGSPVTLKEGSFGFASATTGSYQSLVISKSQFAVPAGTSVDEFRATAVGTGGTLGFYIDPIKLQTVSAGSGGSSGGGTTSGITQDQADARYAQRGNNLSDLTSASTARTNLALGTFATQNYATPPSIGATTPATGKFTTLQATSTLTTAVTGSTQCLHVNPSGVISGTGSDCGTGSGSGSVTTVSVASANGFAGSVANATTTPAITLSTSITGLLKGNGTAISAASSGTDYAPATSGSSILYGNGSGGFSSVTIGSGLSFSTGTLSATGSGSVTTTGSPANGNLTKFSGSSSITSGDLSGDCTTAGTLAVTCTKTSGVSFAASATTDTTNAANISSGNLSVNRLNGGSSASSTTYWRGDGTWAAVVGSGAGAMIQLATCTPVSTNTCAFTSIPGGYSALKIVGTGRSSGSGTGVDPVLMTFNSDTSTNYEQQRLVTNLSTPTGYQATSQTSVYLVELPKASNVAAVPASVEAIIPFYTGTTFGKSVLSRYSTTSAGNQSSFVDVNLSGVWFGTSAITRIDLTETSNFVTGTTFVLYAIL